MSRLDREINTLKVMIQMYCEGKKIRPDEATALTAYTVNQAANCRYGDTKPECEKCKTHCYKPEMREKIKKVMKWSGPRMIYRHPIMLIYHMVDMIRY